MLVSALVFCCQWVNAKDSCDPGQRQWVLLCWSTPVSSLILVNASKFFFYAGQRQWVLLSWSAPVSLVMLANASELWYPGQPSTPLRHVILVNTSEFVILVNTSEFCYPGQRQWVFLYWSIPVSFVLLVNASEFCYPGQGQWVLLSWSLPVVLLFW